MKKTIQLATSIFTATWLLTGTASAAEPNLECKVQLARASENSTEILPKGRDYAKLEISETGAASTEMTFSLNGSTDLAYKLELNAQTKPSNWSRDAIAFKLEVKLWDLKNKKLVATESINSDNVRTRFLLSQLMEKDIAIIASDIPSFEMRTQLLSSGDEQVVNLANKGQWIAATQTALSKALVHPLTADFLSVNCELTN